MHQKGTDIFLNEEGAKLLIGSIVYEQVKYSIHTFILGKLALVLLKLC